MKITWFKRGVVLAVAVVCGARHFAAEEAVEIVASQRTEVRTPSGVATVPLDISLDWSKPQPGITRAVILLHGKGRDVDGYYRGLLRSAHEAGKVAAGSILIAPQFLNEDDVKAHRLPQDVVRWRTGAWEAGGPAVGPAGISAYEVLDAFLLRLADRALFPDLKDIVLAGHSGGGQAVQRYAVVGTAPAEIAAKGIHLRFVVANPSSYLYFSDERPGPHGPGCSGWDRWKYGTRGAPEYVRLTKTRGWTEMEADYASADVIYLMGDEDTDPRQKDLDVSCAGEAEGPTRLARGQAYFAYLKARHPAGWGQRMWLVEGVAHSGPKMVEAPCGVKALFATGTCKDE
jgi:pimeloyl-ACP methyl ester carboxylesterase